MLKNAAVRIFLFALLIAIGMWWGFAAGHEDFGSIENTWYIVALVFVLVLNVLNYLKDKKRGHL